MKMSKLNKQIFILIFIIFNFKTNTSVIADLFDFQASLIDPKNEIVDNLNKLQDALDVKKKESLLGQINNLQEVLNNIKNSTLDALNKFPGQAAALTKEVTDYIESTPKLLIDYANNFVEQKLPQSTKDQVNQINNNLNNLDSSLNDASTQLNNELQDLLNNILETLISSDINNPSQIIQNIQDNFNIQKEKYTKKFDDYSVLVNSEIDKKVTASKDLASALKKEFAIQSQTAKDKLNNLLKTIQDYVLNIGNIIVKTYNEVNTLVKNIGNKVLETLQYISNICDGSSKLFTGIYNFPIIPPLIRLKDSIYHNIRTLLDSFKTDIDKLKKLLDQFIAGELPDINYVFYLIVNLFRGIINCPKGFFDLIGAIDTNLGAITITQPGEDESYIQTLKTLPDKLDANVNSLQSAGSEISTIIDQKSLHPINSVVQDIVMNLSKAVDSIINIFDKTIIDTIRGFYTNIHVAILCFKQTLAYDCDCQKEDPDFKLYYCLSNQNCPCLEKCKTYDAFNTLQSLLSSILHQIEFIHEHLNDIEVDVAWTIGIDVGGSILSLIITLISARYFFTYNDFEKELADKGYSRITIKKILPTIDDEKFNRILDEFYDAQLDPKNMDYFLKFLQKELKLPDDTLKALRESMPTLTKNFNEYLTSISKKFNSINEIDFYKNRIEIGKIYRFKIENAETPKELYDALSQLATLTNSSKIDLLENYKQNYEPPSVSTKDKIKAGLGLIKIKTKISDQQLDNLKKFMEIEKAVTSPEKLRSELESRGFSELYISENMGDYEKSFDDLQKILMSRDPKIVSDVLTKSTDKIIDLYKTTLQNINKKDQKDPGLTANDKLLIDKFEKDLLNTAKNENINLSANDINNYVDNFKKELGSYEYQLFKQDPKKISTIKYEDIQSVSNKVFDQARKANYVNILKTSSNVDELNKVANSYKDLLSKQGIKTTISDILKDANKPDALIKIINTKPSMLINDLHGQIDNLMHSGLPQNQVISLKNEMNQLAKTENLQDFLNFQNKLNSIEIKPIKPIEPVIKPFDPTMQPHIPTVRPPSEFKTDVPLTYGK